MSESHHFILSFPGNLKLVKLKEIVAKYLKLDYNPKTNSILFYRQTYNGLAVLKNDPGFYFPPNSSRDKIPIQFSFQENISEIEIQGLTQYVIHYSSDSIHISSIHKVFIQPYTTYQNIIEKSGLKIEGKFRCVQCGNSGKLSIVSLDSIISDTAFPIRIEKISNEIESAQFIQVQYVDENLNFLIPIHENELFLKIKERIIETLGKDLSSFYFVFLQHFQHSQGKSLENDFNVFQSFTPESMILISSAPQPKNQNYVPEKSVKIFN